MLDIKMLQGALQKDNTSYQMSASNRVVLTSHSRQNDCRLQWSLLWQSVPGTCSCHRKARSPSVEQRVDGMISIDVEADRRQRQSSMLHMYSAHPNFRQPL